MKAQIESFLAGHGEELIAFRRQLHAHPELARHEVETTEAIVNRLSVARLAPKVLSGGTGLTCDIWTPSIAADELAGIPTIALRADIDALAMMDESDSIYESTIPGIAHACGHDAHTTITLGAGLLLQELLAAPGAPIGRVRLLFEPAEEALPGGAVEIIAEGGLDGVEAIYGLHCDPKIDVGRIGVFAGPITSAADIVEIILTGPGGHTARPELTVDLVSLAARVALEVPEVLAEMIGDARAKLIFGSVRAGDAPNVIPTKARLYGTMRTQDHQVWEDAADLIEKAIGVVVNETAATWTFNHTPGVPPVVNDTAATEFLSDVIVAQFGPDAVLTAGQSWGGDTFAWYLETVPGSYARLGTHNPANGASRLDLHAADFDIDERAIAVGVTALAATAYTWLVDNQRD
ncbi:MAG: amidohydrolase [Actinobacteria bacterium]|nr:amidohydrolase [Actinomycetota bacterium]